MEERDPVEPAEDEGAIARMRDLPVGASDPNIIGDAGPTDVPPGTDPPAPDRGDEDLGGGDVAVP